MRQRLVLCPDFFVLNLSALSPNRGILKMFRGNAGLSVSTLKAAAAADPTSSWLFDYSWLSRRSNLPAFSGVITGKNLTKKSLIFCGKIVKLTEWIHPANSWYANRFGE